MSKSNDKSARFSALVAQDEIREKIALENYHWKKNGKVDVAKKKFFILLLLLLWAG